MLASFAAHADFIEVTKLTDTYALRENGELVKYREAQNNLPERIAVNVADFNNSAYVTKDGGLYAMDKTKLADDARAVVKTPVYVDGTYNGGYAYISLDGSLKLPAYGGYGASVLCGNVLDTNGNLVLKTDGTVTALLTGNGTSMQTKDILSGGKSLHGKDGEYLVLDGSGTCWFVPLLNGAFSYEYETLKLDEGVTSCESLDTVLIGNEWSEYDRSALRAGKVAKNLKMSNVLFAYGDMVFINTGRSFGVYYGGKRAYAKFTRCSPIFPRQHERLCP